MGSPSLTGGQDRTFPILSSTCGFPASAQAYSLNLTAVPQGTLSYVTAFPTGLSQPAMASLNAPTGTTTANAAIIAAGDGGSIDVFASNNTDLVIDANGYFAPMAPGGLSLYPLTPCRLLDTRRLPGGQPFSGENDVAAAGGVCGPPVAPAYVLNATVAPPAPLGYLTIWPQGESQPRVATLSAVDGAVTSNMAIVGASNGLVSTFVSNPTQLILDAFGYWAAAPWLSVSSSHTGSFTQGQNGPIYGATYTVSVSNIGSRNRRNGDRDRNLPSGLSLVSISGSGWSCGTSVCTRGDALAAGAAYPPITVIVNVASNAVSPQVNSVTVSGGGAISATATDSTQILLAPDFTIVVTPTYPITPPNVAFSIHHSDGWPQWVQR